MPHSIHPRGNKLYEDLRKMFWWSNMKQEVADYVVKCLTCQQVKIEHQQPAGLFTVTERPRMKVRLGVYEFRGRSTSYPEKKQCNMGSRRSTHQGGALYSQAEYLDIGSAG